jgi:hypothetical protein
MKIEPSFPDHWKTRRLQAACGAEAVVGLIRLWGQAKIKRQFSGLELTPKRLAAVMAYPGDEKRLWEAMTDEEAPWLDRDEGGTWTLHGFEEHQRQIIAMWTNGKRGGRPPLSPTPPIPNNHPLPLPLHPLGSARLPNENLAKPNGFSTETTPTLEQWVEQCHRAGIEKDIAEEIWHDNEGRGCDRNGNWLDYRGQPIRNPLYNAKARAASMRRRRGNSSSNNGAAPGIRNRKELLSDGTGDW